ncbi:MAG TPA: bifunctional 3,4-dihydroxy-2-butanone-4-phosphate synthase/GTP cyclohydrolase II [Bacteroidales bacterium]|nr:MAG: Riboflavin biosynthesis protein RibBA [Bacteroidetes bacterium ADurb.Bin217]HPM12620.1 bifunctional 3,4-dihydroxy-2-butanone-4-phosphate synthase/GTP cyclohydrolase II [Bacteroidales bacterium]
MCGNQQNETKIKLHSIEEAIEDIRNGKIVIVVDNEDRENEGDFICAAELVTPEIVNFMATHGRGLICASLPEYRCDELDLKLMVGRNTATFETPFTVSVDLIGHGCTTGISVYDRAKTLQALVNPTTKPEDLGRPGHIFPLKAKNRGVLRRPGHTEAAVDLSRLAGLTPGGVLVEIMNEDGTMARLPDLMKISEKFGLKIISIKDLIAFLIDKESLVEMGERVKLPTDYGDFELIPFKQLSNGLEHIAIIKGSWRSDEAILVRVHSSCVTGDIFMSQRCDCGNQLHEAMKRVEKEGKGVVLYMNQEGRGIGLFNKIKAYKLQEQGLDTVEANLELGFKDDERDYGVGATILRLLGVRKMRLLTNNPTKRAGLEGYGLEIIENVHIEVPVTEHNHFYMQTKKEKMGHTLDFCCHGKKI